MAAPQHRLFKSMVVMGALLEAALTGCGARAASSESTLPAAHATSAARETSSFEQRWQSACGERGLLGRCPEVLQHGIFEFDIAADEPYRPHLCSSIEPDKDAAIHAALSSERAALRTCFEHAEAGSWVGIELDASTKRDHSPKLPPRALACVVGIVARALAAIDTSGVKGVMVTSGHPNDAPKGVAGSLSKQGIRDRIHAHIGEVRECYVSAIDVWPKLAGRTAAQFVIAPDGSVSIVHTAESSFDNPALECCINTAIRSWQFDRPAGGGVVVVTYPFILEQVD